MNNPFNAIDERLSSIENLLHTLTDRQPETPDANTPKGELLTIEQAAEFLHLSKATIYSKCSRNELPYMKRGKRLYFLREQLLEYVKAGRCETAQEMAENAHEFLTKKKGGQRNG
jgi:excisionase family DNA binding protein